MSVLRPLSRAAVPASAPLRTWSRAFASSASQSDEPKRTVFNDLLNTMRPSPSSPSRPPPRRQNRFANPTATPDMAQPPSNNNNAYTPLASIAGQISIAQQRTREAAESQEGPRYEKQLTRRWRDGDVYSPHDISGVEMSKWKSSQRRPRSKKDVFDMLRINPLDHYWNFAMMSEFQTEMGKIKHSNDTGLRPVNQRKMAKALRRAIGLGLMPSVHQHPEILNAANKRRGL